MKTKMTSNTIAAQTALSLMLLTVVLATLGFAQTSRQNNRDVADRQVKSTDGEYIVLTKPLNPTDSRAQLPEELRNVQLKRIPVIGKMTEATPAASPEAVGTVEYDVTTGQTTQQSADADTIPEFVKALLKNGKNSLPGSFGANFQVDSSDKQNDKAQTEKIVGTDDRVRVTPTTSAPWRAMTKLYFTAPDGYTWVCSGALVGPKHVLTAAHCVYDSEHGGYVKKATAVPGQDVLPLPGGVQLPYAPYGSASATKMRVFLGWILYDGSSQQYDHDMALLTLNSPIGNSTGWLGMKAVADGEWANDLVLRTAGYPIDLNQGQCLYKTQTEPGMFDPLMYQIQTRVDSAAGQSGSPFYFTEGNTRYIVGVLSHDFEGPYLETNFTRLTSPKLQVILNWMAAD